MIVQDLIFSNNSRYKIARHSIFWILWILYYAIIASLLMSPYYGFMRSFFESLTEQAESTPLDMCFCYFILYYLFPRFLFTGRYVPMLFLWLMGSFAFIVLYEVNATLIAPYIRHWFQLKTSVSSRSNYTYDFFILFSQINMEGCLATSIKLGKLWYVKQQELNLLKNENEKIQPHEEQGLVQPAFLTDLLKRMEFLANENPLVAAKSIKKIRNLLLYILYEDASPQVSLKKELLLLQEYVDLEKLTAEKNIEVTALIEAVPEYETIAPSIILPFIENAFKQVSCYSLNKYWINIHVHLHQSMFNMQLSWGKPIDTSSLVNGRNVILHNISKRLKLIYPQSHHLKMIIESEKVQLSLSIDLKKAVN